jgi:hypothetical protein
MTNDQWPMARATAWASVREAGGPGSARAGRKHEGAKGAKDHEDWLRPKGEGWKGWRGGMGIRVRRRIQGFSHRHQLLSFRGSSWCFTSFVTSCFRLATALGMCAAAQWRFKNQNAVAL